MTEILDMCCAIIAKITNESIMGALVPMFCVWVLVETCFACIEKVFWGSTFQHVGDVVLMACFLLFYLYHLAFLARVKR